MKQWTLEYQMATKTYLKPKYLHSYLCDSSDLSDLSDSSDNNDSSDSCDSGKSSDSRDSSDQTKSLKNFDHKKRKKNCVELMDQAWAGFYKPGQQQRILFPEWNQDKMTVSKKYTPQRD